MEVMKHTNAEKLARERLANNGRNPANRNAGIATGSDLHLCEMLLQQIDTMRGAFIHQQAALETAIKVAGEAREEWDKAPAGMKAGKLLIALIDPSLHYRSDITSMHAARALLKQED